MLITTDQNHQLEFDDKDGVIKLLSDAITKPTFKSFNVYVSTEWNGSSKRNVYTISLTEKHATNS